MGTRFDVIRAVEACYQDGVDDAAWFGGIFHALRPIETGAGLYGQLYAIGPGGSREIGTSHCDASLSPGELEAMDRDALRGIGAFPPEMQRRFYSPVPPVDYATRRAARAGLPMEATRQFLASRALQDLLGIFAVEPSGRVVFIGNTVPEGKRRLAPRTLHRLNHFSAHLTSGARLRRAMARREGGAASPEAVLDPGGRVLDASGEARPPGARALLSAAVRQLDRARGGLRRSDPDEALAIWMGLVDGTWSLVDQVESDGRRLVLAHRNQPGVRDPRALSMHERACAAYAAIGHQNKFIGYLLGLAPSTVDSHLRGAMRKLGAPSRAALIRLLTGSPLSPSRDDPATSLPYP